MSYFDDVVEPALYKNHRRHKPIHINTKHRDEFGEAVVWTTQTGDKLVLEDMDIKHLTNCRNLLQRRALETTYPNLMGDMAQKHAEQEYEAIQDHFSYIIKCFDNEIKIRENKQ